jgi:pyruvate/2-oxoglutarate dehydrogenase complex dihydrolipoamide acyltransferase (E2) component
VLLRIDASEGGEYEVGAVLAWIGEQGEEPPSPA